MSDTLTVQDIRPAPPKWRSQFRRISELEQGEVKMLIEHILVDEGTTFLASLPGVGKTWIALQMAKALRTGQPLFGRYRVVEKVPVVYLVPEMGSRAIRTRAEKLGIPDSEEFLVRTLKEGIMQLDSPSLLEMVRTLKPVIFLDTAVRFLKGAEENSASANSAGLADAVFALVRNGARAVICLHHSPKASSKQSVMTLENILRGTGDFGAMAEVVWGIEWERRRRGKSWDNDYMKESQALTRLRVECLKGRDIPDVADPFVIQGRPYVDKCGDFAVLKEGDLIVKPGGPKVEERISTLRELIGQDPTVSCRSLSKATGWNHTTVKEKAKECGYRWTEEGWRPASATPAPEVDIPEGTGGI